MSTTQAKPKYNLHLAVWRWHFWAGLIVLPLLILITLTGALIVFDKEFTRWYYQDLIYVDNATGDRASLDTIRENLYAGLAPVGEVRIESLHVPVDPNKSVYALVLAEPGHYVYAYAHPTTGEYIGHYKYEASPMRMLTQIHRRLMFPKVRDSFDEWPGDTGSITVELITSWAVILMFTGIYLWWPKNWKKVKGIWLPRINGKKYQLWRDWHTIPTLYFSIILILILLTGLVYSHYVGDGFRRTEEWAANDEVDVIGFYRASEPIDDEAELIPIDDMLAIIHDHEAHEKMVYSVNVANEHNNNRLSVISRVNADTYNPVESTYMLIDRQTGEVRGEANWANSNLLSKARRSAFGIHTGSIFGLPTKILAVLACVVLIFASVSGAVMWWVRRPQGSMGVPGQKAVLTRPPVWVTSYIIVSSVMLPTVGVSLIVVLTLDYLLARFYAARFEVNMQPMGDAG